MPKQSTKNAASALRILFVEDNDDLRMALAHLLRGNDREVVECATGEEALDAFASSKFDLVVTDISLPGISGTDLTRDILRSQPLYWVVLCSAYDCTEWANQLGKNVRSLIKPFDLDAMERLLAEISASVKSQTDPPNGSVGRVQVPKARD